ncbi:TPA: helix-turn-helix transcriptional regulator [Listeria monocytogenes]|nr:helix-turn-helix transcriptional regulator [Listeria monocytogenes]
MRMDIVKVFASNIKKYRILKGLSQEAFAEKAGLHRTYISAVEREKRSIALDNIQKIADALEIDTYKLFIDEKIVDSANTKTNQNGGKK